MGIRPADFLPGGHSAAYIYGQQGLLSRFLIGGSPTEGEYAVGKPMIVIGSVTYAMKGQKLLAHYGIRSSVERIYRSSADHGCGYGLFVAQRTDEAEQILRQGGIPVTERTEWEA